MEPNENEKFPGSESITGYKAWLFFDEFISYDSWWFKRTAKYSEIIQNLITKIYAKQIDTNSQK